MGSAGCGAAPLKSQSAKVTACYRIGAVICSLPRASLRSGAWFDLLSGSLACLCGLELGTVSQHRMHDDRKAPGERDPSFPQCRSLGDGERPILELQRPLVARQHDVCGIVQQCPQAPVAAFRDAAGVVGLARLVAPRYQTEIGTDVTRSLEAAWIVDGRCEGESGERSDTRDGHEPAASLGRSHQLPDIHIDRRNGGEHSGARGEQAAHSGRQADDALAGA